MRILRHNRPRVNGYGGQGEKSVITRNSVEGSVKKSAFDSLEPAIIGFEKAIADFNIFSILRFEHGEIRHSNFLGWLLQPNEPHGLGSTFLAGFLLRISRDAGNTKQSLFIRKGLAASPLVEVHREWPTSDGGALDLLLRVRSNGNRDLVVAIENKLGAKQSPKQLKRYRDAVKNAFSKECEFLYVFLSRRDQSPHDRNWIRADYKQVSDELSKARSVRKDSVGKEASLFIEHYLEMLEDKDMKESEIKKHAESFYSKHKQALDVLFKYRPGYERNLIDLLKQSVEGDAETEKICIMQCSRNYVRFLPEKLEIPINRIGDAWGESGSAYILCELECWEGCIPQLGIVEGKSPDHFRKKLWNIARTEKFSGIESQRRLPKDFIWLYTATWDRKVGEAEFPDEKKAAEEIWKWAKKVMKTDQFRSAVTTVSEELSKLSKTLPENDR